MELGKTCKHCKFSAGEKGNRQCRIDPPQMQLFLVPKPNLAGGPPQLVVESASGWPTVLDSQWCGKQEPKFTVVQ